VRQLLGSLEAKGIEGGANDEGLVARLNRLQKDGDRAGGIKGK